MLSLSDILVLYPALVPLLVILAAGLFFFIYLNINCLFVRRPHAEVSLHLHRSESADDGRLISLLSDAVGYATLPSAPVSVFDDFNFFIERSFPLVHKYAEIISIGANSFIYHMPGSSRPSSPILLYISYAVKPSLERQAYPPFAGTVAESCVYGRGTLTGKTELICMMDSLERLLADHRVPLNDVYVVVCSSPDAPSTETEAALAYFKKNRIRFRIAVGTGGYTVEDFPLVGLPVTLLSVSDSGEAAFRITPRSGCSDPRQALRYAEKRLAGLKLPSYDNRFIQSLLKTLTPYMPYHRRLIFSNYFFFKPLVRDILARYRLLRPLLTSVPLGISRSPGEGSVSFSMSVAYGDTLMGLLSCLSSLLSDLPVEIETLSFIEPPADDSGDAESFRNFMRSEYSAFTSGLVLPYVYPRASGLRLFRGISEHTLAYTPALLNSLSLATHLFGNDINEAIPVASVHLISEYYTRLITTDPVKESPEA